MHVTSLETSSADPPMIELVEEQYHLPMTTHYDIHNEAQSPNCSYQVSISRSLQLAIERAKESTYVSTKHERSTPLKDNRIQLGIPMVRN